jgi:hypothetical protein
MGSTKPMDRKTQWHRHHLPESVYFTAHAYGVSREHSPSSPRYLEHRSAGAQERSP